ncbi:MAG: serine hydrolase [Longimicrobiales bacterium]
MQRPWFLAARCVLVIAAGATAVSPLAAQRLERVREPLEQRIAQHEGTVGVAVIDLRTDEILAIGADEPFPSASVIKVPLLVEVMDQVERGRLRLDEPIMLLDIDKQPGSGVLQFLDTPHELSVRDAAFLMIALSDNTATNLLIDKVGIRPVNDRMDSLGLPRTTLHSKTFQRATSIAVDSSVVYGLGVTTPLEMARLLAMIHRGEVISATASQTMLELLDAQFSGTGLPRYLPSGSVAHKTGELDAARHDCGIVDTEQAAYAICVMTKENADTSWRLDNEAHLLIADVARLVHRALGGDA